MTEEFQIRVLPQVAYNEANLKAYIAQEKGLDQRTIYRVRVLKRSIDARHRDIYVNLKVRIYVNEFPQDDAYTKTDYQDVSNKPSVIVVGEGPGGLFASLKLIELGLCPVLLERGKNVRDRKLDIALIKKTQEVDSESNYCFGEGGAGAYSDGKLYTRSKKRGPVDKILNVFCQHGASTSILADAHPHIGTDKLPRVIGPVILATGHSARDVYRYLAEANIEMEAKGIAVGVRLEHPSHLIDQIQYHNKNGKGKYLPTAEYSFVTQAQGRGVYSFCMCPGGFVIPSATGPEQMVTNGMSPANRGTQWSNSGMVVQLNPEDIEGDDLLRIMHYQEKLEHDTWLQGNRKQTAPAQRMADFVNNRLSYDLPKSSYAPGLISSPLHFWMPSFITQRLQEAFKTFGKQAHGFLTNEAVMIASETRTSSPVRILRDREKLMHIRLAGLFPCAEGAGYAGGIVSAGIDGERCAEMAAAYLEQI